MLQFKTPEVKRRYPEVHAKLRAIVDEMAAWLFLNGRIDLVVVESVTTPEEDLALNRVSKSHQEKRGIDLRVNGWPKKLLEDFCTHFSKYNSTLGALPKSKGERTFLVHKPHGSGPHIHLQLGADVVKKLNAEISADSNFLA